jgi:hypothetical protein
MAEGWYDWSHLIKGLEGRIHRLYRCQTGAWDCHEDRGNLQPRDQAFGAWEILSGMLVKLAYPTLHVFVSILCELLQLTDELLGVLSLLVEKCYKAILWMRSLELL